VTADKPDHDGRAAASQRPDLDTARENFVKAVVYKAAFDVAVETVADPRIEQPPDAVIRITTANICGSDLHPYEGRAPLDAGMVLGHENMGVVEEIGSGVDRISVGDQITWSMPVMAETPQDGGAGYDQQHLTAIGLGSFCARRSGRAARTNRKTGSGSCRPRACWVRPRLL
jgi:hypothetical protein